MRPSTQTTDAASRESASAFPGIEHLTGGILGLVAVGTVLAFLSLPNDIELQEMLLQESRFDEALALVDADAGDRLSQAYRARLLYESGDIAGAITVFESLDASGQIDTQGLETLAWYYHQAGRLRDKNLTLLRLSGTHLNDVDSGELLDYFVATSMRDEAIQVMEHRMAAGYAGMREASRLAMAYRYAGQNERALSLYLALDPEDLQAADAIDLRNFIRLMKLQQRDGELEAALPAWIPETLAADDMYGKLLVLIEQGQASLALGIAAERRKDDSRFAEVYDAALHRLRGSGEAYAVLNVQRLHERLLLNAERLRQGAAGAEKEARSLLYEYFDQADAESAYEALLQDGYPAPELLKEALYARLSKQGNKTQLARRLASDADDVTLSLAQRRKIADQLVYLGEYQAADALYRKLVAIEGPAGEAMQGLLYTWSRSGRGADIDWLGERLLGASAGDYTLWENAFLGAAKAPRLARWLEQHAGANVRQAQRVLNTRITLASWQSGAPGLSSLLTRAANDRRLSAALRSRYFTLACDQGVDVAASQLWQGMPADTAEQGQHQACAARLAHADKRHRDAIRHYEAALSSGETLAATDQVRHAQSVQAVSGRAAAQPVYRAALDALPPVDRASAAELQTRGYIHQLLGNPDAAISAYQQVLARTRDKRLQLSARRELMRLYVDTGNYEQALALGCEDGDCDP